MLSKSIKRIFVRRKKKSRSVTGNRASENVDRPATLAPSFEKAGVSASSVESSSSTQLPGESESEYVLGSSEGETTSATDVAKGTSPANPIVTVEEEVSGEFSIEGPTIEPTKTEGSMSEPTEVTAFGGDATPGHDETPARSETPDAAETIQDSASSLSDLSPRPNIRRQSNTSEVSMESDVFRDSHNVKLSYDSIPSLEQITLPRGGISMETQAVGRVQYGIPPETIKDSMKLGIPVPTVYIVPVERFCREMGPALGVNLAEFEFPAYFNFFVSKKRCTLIVDNEEAERNIRRVFSETLLGPAKFRRQENPVPFTEEDFAPDFPREMIPNFTKELEYFRIMPDGHELVLETLLKFRHFEMPRDVVHENLGVPPPLPDEEALVEPSDSKLVSFALEEDEEEEEDIVEEAVPKSLEGVESREQSTTWTYSQARWIAVAVVYPEDATPEQIQARTVKRVEIFKMPGGTEYIVHDIDENNQIIGKARFAGHVKVSESMSVAGFGGSSLDDIIADALDEDDDVDSDGDDDDSEGTNDSILGSLLPKNPLPPTFHPPSFGVTVLGNSHGFDKSGSVSGYVLWINGRGVMIDPPPYSSATLEREGIRPRTIVGIILTHCHADHDAGAFQKVLTGSPVVVITTPTIYQSFIRKYAALSALSPALLRHSHRHKPAIIGTPLRFQGATFHFTYTLHTIPCVGFRVEWRGRSMVFTGDHFNSPPAIDKLQQDGVLSKARADDLRNLPLQDTDLLLHEAGAPPIHTPLEVLLQLPQRVKRRLYVVHTSALPPDCELRVAPTGTAGTIRLDQLQQPATAPVNMPLQKAKSTQAITLQDDSLYSSPWSNASSEYRPQAQANESDHLLMHSSFGYLGSEPAGSGAASHAARSASQFLGRDDTKGPPLVSLRPASSTDAWFILNLLSAVPFLTSLSYTSTMELLETARVDAFCMDDVVVPSSRRNSVLCVVWEGTCVEVKADGHRPRKSAPRKGLLPSRGKHSRGGAVWHAGDWTGPIALQPEKRLSGESDFAATHDVVAMSSEGVKVITVEFSNLHAILKSGSTLYRRYLERTALQRKVVSEPDLTSQGATTTTQLLDQAVRDLNVLELLDCNSALRKFSAVQKRHLESLAEGPFYFSPGERLWRAGGPVDKAFIIVSGTASFAPKRRNAGSAGVPSFVRPPRPYDASSSGDDPSSGPRYSQISSIGDRMRIDALTAIKQLGKNVTQEDSSIDFEEADAKRGKPISETGAKEGQHEGQTFSSTDPKGDYAELHEGLQKRADHLEQTERSSPVPGHTREDTFAQYEHALAELEGDADSLAEMKGERTSLSRRRSSRARFANKVLGRLYNRRAFTAGLVFSRGHFLGDISKMVAGLVSSDVQSQVASDGDGDDSSVPRYGFGEQSDHYRGGESIADMVIPELEEQIVHSSTLAAGKEGCVVLVFPKAALIPFLDEYPGLLLSLLGTQVVV